MATTTASTGQAHNWRRDFFFTVEIVFAVIAATGEGFMYASYLPAGPERWPEAIARATISQFIIILFGIAAIEALRIRSLFMRVVTMLAAWGVTIGASLVTFWFLLDAAQVFRDSAMLAPLKHASITLPNGAVIATSTIDILLVAALPFFQTALNILAPIITADHAPESLEAQAERQQREEAQAAHKARMTALRAQGFGAALHAGITSAKGAVVPQETHDNADGDTPDNESVRAGNDSGPANVVKMTKRGQWTSRDLKHYALTTYGVTLSDVEAQSAMRVLSKGKRSGTSYVAPSRVGRSWVDETVGANSSSTQQRA
ncbi:MAG TPA: hypothetical protein VFN11_14305 [Ktedonobacterales bacterium]|nr:hypothetical protein [Ktedonobacterales bacterium]